MTRSRWSSGTLALPGQPSAGSPRMPSASLLFRSLLLFHQVRPPLPAQSSCSVSTTARTAVNNETFGGKGDDCGPNEEYSECPESGRSCEASCDWTKFPETTPNCPRQCGTARCVCKAGYVRMTNDEDACVPFTFCEKEVLYYSLQKQKNGSR